jgi:hypothetical protein
MSEGGGVQTRDPSPCHPRVDAPTLKVIRGFVQSKLQEANTYLLTHEACAILREEQAVLDGMDANRSSHREMEKAYTLPEMHVI